jgi:hypothetical protein
MEPGPASSQEAPRVPRLGAAQPIRRPHDFLPADIPTGVASISVELRLDEVTTGTAFLDDLMVEPLP